MKKFFTAIPLQPEGKLNEAYYHAVDNTRLQMDRPTRFPIMTAIQGYAVPGEDFRLIAICTDNPNARRNGEYLRQELAELCQSRGLVCSRGVEFVSAPEDERVSAHTGTFQKLIDLVEDDDELFSCMTYGTKPLSTVMRMAVQYAYRVKMNTSISCIVYGHLDHSSNQASVYDMTALVQLDEIIRVLAEQRVENPKKIIDQILSM